MPRRGGSVHVVTTKRRYKGRLYATHLLRRSYREDGKVKNETLGNLSHLPDSVIELIRRALRGETLLPADERFTVTRSRPHGHVAAVVGTIKKLGVDRLLASRRTPERDRAVALIAARVLAPDAKLATARALDANTPPPPWARCWVSRRWRPRISTRLWTGSGHAKRRSRRPWPSDIFTMARWCSTT